MMFMIVMNDDHDSDDMMLKIVMNDDHDSDE